MKGAGQMRAGNLNHSEVEVLPPDDLESRWLEILTAPVRHQLTVVEVCRRYGVARKTFYNYRARYLALGVAGLEQRSRRPHNSPLRTPSDVVEAIVALRKARPGWGAHRIRDELLKRESVVLPSVSTVYAILRREGLVNGASTPKTPVRDHSWDSPVGNDLWHVEVITTSTTEGEPLAIMSIMDSRADLAVAAHVIEIFTAEALQECVDKAAHEYGPPRRLARATAASSCGQHAGHWLTDLPRASTSAALQAVVDERRWLHNVERLRGRPDAWSASRTCRVNAYGVINYRKRKIQIGTRFSGRTVRVVEDFGLARIHHGTELVRDLMLGAKGTYHGIRRRSVRIAGGLLADT